jgi:hypothetical protein
MRKLLKKVNSSKRLMYFYTRVARHGNRTAFHANLQGRPLQFPELKVAFGVALRLASVLARCSRSYWYKIRPA